jgi:hypothetical protein
MMDLMMLTDSSIVSQVSPGTSAAGSFRRWEVAADETGLPPFQRGTKGASLSADSDTGANEASEALDAPP